MFYPHIERRVYRAVLESRVKASPCRLIVETEEEYRQAGILLRQFGRDDIELILERREDYEGEGYIYEMNV